LLTLWLVPTPRPGLPAELEQHLTATVSGLWVVWADKLAQPTGDLFIPITGGVGYPADAAAERLDTPTGTVRNPPVHGW